MNTYDIYWSGLDRGHENTWNPKLWRGVLNAFAKYSPVDLKDINGSFFTTLKTEFPDVQWVTGTRTFFRDGREAWHTTAVVKFPKGSDTASITGLGKKIVEGRISYAEVLSATALQSEEKGEHPFAILLDALRNAPCGRGLSVEDLIKVMRHYREGDDISEVLSLPNETIPDTKLRRFKGILQLMVYAGLAIMVDGLYFAGQDASTFSKITGDELREEFIRWLNEENVVGSGKASSYEIALEDASVIAQVYCDRFKMPSVYEMPDSTLESLRDFIAAEAKKECEHPGSGLFCSLSGLHGVSYWRDGYCSAAIGELIRFKSNFREAKSAQKFKQAFSSTDCLSVALKLFAEKRYEEEWQRKTSTEEHQSIYLMSDLTPGQLAAGSFEDFYKNFLLKVWAFKNGGSRRYGQIKDDGAKKADYRKFIVKLKEELKSFDTYFPPDKKCPDGMGVGMLTEIMMRFWPKSCCSYNKSLIHEALVTLRLAKGDFVWPKTPSIYQEFMGKCATILRKMEQMKLPRRPDPNNDEPPDYITVNEFLWFVHDYKDLIKEEVMKKLLKSDKPTKYDEGKRQKLKFDSGSKDDKLLLRLLSALRAKPFAILAGHSGTGKSRYVKKLAYMTCNMDELRTEGKLPGNYLLLQVKPNWHDSTELLGFRNAMDGNRYQKTALMEFLFRAYHFKDTPFFLCLDEMNLAPVEQYFAEFLSSMESKEPIPLNDISDKEDNLLELGCEWTDARDYLAAKGFSIPNNLFIVGTVNMDETTNQFSRKVLDRAFTIEMTDVDFASYGKVTEPSYEDTIGEPKIQELLKGPKSVDKLDDDDIVEGAPLVKVQKALEPTAFAVAYRFANEYTLLKMAIECLDPEKKMGLDALDQAVLMKVLPRIAGERDYIEMVYGKKEDEGLRKALVGKADSLKKIEEILKRAKDMNAQYITFWP